MKTMARLVGAYYKLPIFMFLNNLILQPSHLCFYSLCLSKLKLQRWLVGGLFQLNHFYHPANLQTRKPTLRLGTAQKASEVRYTLIIFSFSLNSIKCCLSIIFVLLLLFQIYHFTVLLSLFHCTHLFRLGRV